MSTDDDDIWPSPQMEEEEEEDALNLDAPEENDELDDQQEPVPNFLEQFSKTDFIMETEVFTTLSRYFESGGGPEPVVQTLADNYVGLAQLCNLLAEWLIPFESDETLVKKVFESQLSAHICRYFNPKKADRIFELEGGDAGGIDWLPELIAHAPWRSLVFSLAEQYSDCLMLNFAVKLISDAGYQHEISNVTTAAQQLEIFSRVLTAAVEGVLGKQDKGPDVRAFRSAAEELVRVASHSDHTYLYTQALFHLLAHQEQHKAGGVSAAMRHLEQMLRAQAEQQGHETTAIVLALHNATGSCNPALTQAMHSMLSKGSLNPADMTLLYNWYQQQSPPSIDLIRDPLFIELIIDALFRPRATKVHVDYRPKYLYLLAYATCASDAPKKGARKSQFKDELENTRDALEKMSNLCQERSATDSSNEILLELKDIFDALKIPVVAAGMLHWIKYTVIEPDYFKVHPEPVPVHLALLDEIASNHPLLHSRIFHLLTELFESTSALESAGEKIMERQRVFIDRMVHLLSVGYALPVTEHIATKYEQGAADTSLVRYFVTETLEIVSPPFSIDFIRVFLPLVENPEIVDDSVHEKLPAAREFVQHCKAE